MLRYGGLLTNVRDCRSQGVQYCRYSLGTSRSPVSAEALGADRPLLLVGEPAMNKMCSRSAGSLTHLCFAVWRGAAVSQAAADRSGPHEGQPTAALSVVPSCSILSALLALQSLGVYSDLVHPAPDHAEATTPIFPQDGFFYSYTYNLAATLQTNMETGSKQPAPFNSMFVWNEFLTR